MPILEVEDARRAIREILKSPLGLVFPTQHCKERMIERNVQMDDVIHLLFWGTLEPGQKVGDLERNVFRVRGADLEGEPLVIVLAIEREENRLTCISVF
jgi:hypothetical protein